MKHIRWQGLVLFLGVLGVLAGLWFFFADGWVKRAIENYGTKAVGAKVELDRADLSLFPAGLELYRLQVTDPDEPLSNALEIARIRLALDGMHLLLRKAIVEEMAMEGVRFKTPRKTSGAVLKKETPTEPPAAVAKTDRGMCGRLSVPSFEKPDVGKILQKEELQSVKLAQALKADTEAAKVSWQRRLEELPDQEKLRGYRARVEKAKSEAKGNIAGALGSAGDLMAIRKDLERDLDPIRLAHREVTDQVGGFKTRLDAVIQAPQEDFHRLKAKYGLDPQGLGNWTQLILGFRLCDWMERALSWYAKIKPFLARPAEKGEVRKPAEDRKPARGRGVDIRFRESPPFPDFLVRKIHASVRLEGGEIGGRILNLTPDQHLLGRPTTLDFAGKDLKGLSAFTLAGEINRVDPSKARDTLNAAAKGYAIKDLPLAQGTQWPLKLAQGVLDLDLRAGFTSGAMEGTLGMVFQSARFAVGPGEEPGTLMKSISSALSGVSAFSAKAHFSGTPENYDIRLTSDLDQVLKDSAGKALEKEAARFQEELRKGVFERAEGPVGEAKGGMGALEDITKELNARLNLGAGILGAQEEKIPEKGLKLPFKAR